MSCAEGISRNKIHRLRSEIGSAKIIKTQNQEKLETSFLSSFLIEHEINKAMKAFALSNYWKPRLCF